MKNIFDKNREIYFVTKHSKIDKRGKFTLILSPEFYWVKRENLPVKRVYEAKKLAPSIFDGFLPNGNYSYIVYKDKEAYILIAYDKEQILEDLSKIVEDIEDIEEVRFTQTEFEPKEDCVEVDNQSSLVWIDGVAVFVPRLCADEGRNILDLLKEVKLSKYKVKISQKDLIDAKSLVLYLLPFILLSLSFLIEYAIYKKSIFSLESKREDIIRRYHLPPTSIQLNSIKNSLLNTYKKQKKIRDFIDFASGIDTKKGEFIKSLAVDFKEAFISIKISSPVRKNFIKKYFGKKYKVKRESLKGDILNLEIVL